ncbi:hypothetical protein Clacol_005000 [Clathrus columnatus]|uniref:Uncharacterized protein n=1 Tax=Clathrus columnatus TaxID=1419009 RepID=A0AAV5A816_9AGAM|nr:hypothetical protein Clacol_005000 [Clathrus columnatus]
MLSPIAKPVSVLVGAPKTQEECISWAQKNQRVFVEVDEELADIVAKTVNEDDDDDDIARYQRKYDAKVENRRTELLREKEEAKKKKKEEDMAKMRELFPDLAADMDKLKSLQQVLVPATQPAEPSSPVPISTTSMLKPKPKPKPVLKKTATVTTRPVIMRRMPAMSHTPISPKTMATPATKLSGSLARTINLVKEDKSEVEVEIVPPKKVKFIPPIPKGPVFGMGDVIEDGCVSCTNKGKVCHHQDLQNVCCYKCRQSRTACSLVPEMRALLERKERAIVSKKMKKAVAGSSVNVTSLDPIVSLLEDKLDVLIKVMCGQQDTQDQLLAKVDLMLTDLCVVADYCRIHNEITPLGPIPDANLAWKLFSAELAFKANLVDLVDVEDQEILENDIIDREFHPDHLLPSPSPTYSSEDETKYDSPYPIPKDSDFPPILYLTQPSYHLFQMELRLYVNLGEKLDIRISPTTTWPALTPMKTYHKDLEDLEIIETLHYARPIVI